MSMAEVELDLQEEPVQDPAVAPPLAELVDEYLRVLQE